MVIKSGTYTTYYCCVQFVSLHKLQDVLHDLAMVWIMVRLGSGFGLVLTLGLELCLGPGQKFANSTHAISKMHSVFCKLCRFTNHVHHKYYY